MRVVYLVLLILLIVSCSRNIEIKNSDFEVEKPYMRTTSIQIENDSISKEAPKIEIINPKYHDLTKVSNLTITLHASNFKIVPIGNAVKDGEGHFHVWLDSEKKVTAEQTVTFEKVASGYHTIVAELVQSNHSSLNPRIIKTKTINVESGYTPPQEKQEENIKEYEVEADDNDFYPNKLKAKIGDKVIIHFKFRDNSIYFAGLDVKGPFPTIEYKLKGEQPVTAEFIMKDETKITSYWPSSGVRKADLAVEVEE